MTAKQLASVLVGSIVAAAMHARTKAALERLKGLEGGV